MSLDFELGWGVHDLMPMEACQTKLQGARSAVPRLLGLLSEYGIHATWAVVGLLFFHSRRDLVRSLPPYLPKYTNKVYSPYRRLSQVGENEIEDPYHYGASLIEKIRETPNQEIGTHTFSHYYCLEDGQDPNAFREDLRAAARTAARAGIVLRSCIFPRNQVQESYLPVLAEVGITAFRDNAPGWLYAPRQRAREIQARRALRLADSYLPLSGHNTYSAEDLGHSAPIRIPASCYLRPYSRPRRWLEPLRASRIKEAMTYAARHGRLYHLWTHPEDMGLDTEDNLTFLRGVFEHYAGLEREYGMKSMHMDEVCRSMLGEHCAAPRYSA